MVQGQGGQPAFGCGAFGQGAFSLFAHAVLHRPPLTVDRIERLRQFRGPLGVVGAQALDAQGHVGQPTGGVDARAQRKTEVLCGGLRGVASGHMEQGLQAGLQPAAADALEALCDQATVVGIELHHIGHSAQGHQIQQLVQSGLAAFIEYAALSQFSPQGQQHIEHDAHAGQVLAGKGAAALVRVHDHIGIGCVVGRQVVVGDHHLESQGASVGYACRAGDAVVHGDEHIRAGCACEGQVDDGRRKPVAVHAAVGHHVVQLVGARAQHL